VEDIEGGKMEPLVSICCTAYNHEKYIADAIDSFLMQDTNFPIEIIIHDDASTDNTPNIIREYERKYPDIIKPIYQTENQYSKRKKILLQIIYPKVKGKYIATCEGDDFWTDSKKLQKQVDILERYEQYSFCFHAVRVVDTNKVPKGRFLGPYGKGNREYSMKDNIKPTFAHLSSLLIRTEYLRSDMPEWYMNSRHGDYALALYISAIGKGYFIDEVMSSYRIGVENSLMTKLRQNTSNEARLNYYIQRISTLEEADKYYEYRFHNEIEEANLESRVKVFLLKNDYSKAARIKYKEYVKKYRIRASLILLLSVKFPKFLDTLAKIKSYLKKKF